MSKTSAIETQEQPRDDWSVPKLIGLALGVLATFFVFIYFVAP